MKIYCVSTGEYSDWRIIAAFSTEEKAIAFRDKYRAYDSSVNDEFDEFDVDGRETEEVRVLYQTWLDNSGGLKKRGTTTEFCAKRFSYGQRAFEGFYATSAVSPEHADKVAAEARQEYLRARGQA